MARPSKPFYRKSHQAWYCTINGTRYRLGTDRQAADREFHRLMVQGGRASGSTLTVRELADLFLDDGKSRLAEATWINYQVWLQRWCDHAGGMRAELVKPHMVTAWLKRHPTWGGNTRAMCITILKVWSRWCRRSGYLDHDSLADLQGHTITRRPPPEPGAIQAVEGAVLSRRFLEIWTVALATGARPGELRTLEASGVDMTSRIMRVDGKTGPRPLAFPESIRELLSRLCTEHPSGPIFLNARGKPWTRTALVHHMHSVKRRAGITGVVMYSARGYLATQALKQGVDLATVAKMLGHSNPNVTMRHYLAIDDDMLREAANKAAG